MTNRIDGPTQPRTPVAGGSGSASRTEAGAQATGGADRKSADTVELTDQANRLRKLEESLASLPATDSGRVEAVRQAIAEGRFEVNAERIADGLLDFEKGIR